MDYKQLFFFDSMLTPKIITFFYWLSLVSVISAGLAMMVQYSFLIGLATVIFGPIAVRIYHELLIVIFKIHDNLRKIADKKE